MAGCYVDTNLLRLPISDSNAFFVRDSPLSARLKIPIGNFKLRLDVSVSPADTSIGVFKGVRYTLKIH